MKIYLSLFLVGCVSLTAFAAPHECPGDLKTVQKCKAAPETGDSRMIARIANAVVICADANNELSFSLMTSEGEISPVFPVVETVSRAGGTSYVLEKDGDQTKEISIESRALRNKVKRGTFTIGDGEEENTVSCTYVCQKVSR